MAFFFISKAITREESVWSVAAAGDRWKKKGKEKRGVSKVNQKEYFNEYRIMVVTSNKFSIMKLEGLSLSRMPSPGRRNCCWISGWEQFDLVRANHCHIVASGGAIANISRMENTPAESTATAEKKKTISLHLTAIMIIILLMREK